MHRISGTHQNKSLISLKTVGLSSMSSSSSSISFLFVFCFTATLKRGRIRFSCRLSHVCSEFDSRSLPYNVLWDGPGIQEVTLCLHSNPEVSHVRPETPPQTQRAIGLDQHTDQHTRPTHTNADKVTGT